MGDLGRETTLGGMGRSALWGGGGGTWIQKPPGTWARCPLPPQVPCVFPAPTLQQGLQGALCSSARGGLAHPLRRLDAWRGVGGDKNLSFPGVGSPRGVSPRLLSPPAVVTGSLLHPLCTVLPSFPGLSLLHPTPTPLCVCACGGRCKMTLKK